MSLQVGRDRLEQMGRDAMAMLLDARVLYEAVLFLCVGVVVVMFDVE